METKIQAYLGDISGSVPDHHNQLSITVKQSHNFVFQHIYMFCLYYIKSIKYAVGLPHDSDGKESACGAGDLDLITGLIRIP